MSFISSQAQEILDQLSDKVASLKAAGKFKEAAEADREYARVYKSYQQAPEAAEQLPGDLAIKPEPAPVTPTSESLGVDMSAVSPETLQPKTFGMGAPLAAAGGLGLAGSYVGEENAAPEATAMAAKPPVPEEKKSTPTAPAEAAPVQEAKPSIPFRRVKNYLDDLGAAPEYDPTQFNSQLDANQLKINSRAEALKGEVDAALALHNTTTDNLAKRELMETIMHGIGQIVAGMHGLKSGMDLSGTKFTPTDWSRKAQEAQNKLQNVMAVAKQKYAVDEDALNKERQNILQNKEDANRQYADMFRKWEHEGQKLSQKTNYLQEERNYEDSLKRFEIDLAERAEKSSDKPDMQIDNLAKERESEIDNLKKQWRVGAAAIAKMEGDAKAAKLEELRLIDETVTAQTGIGMLPRKELYDEPKNWIEGIGYKDIIKEANKHQEALNGLAKTNPQAASLISQRNTAIKQYTQQAMAQGLSLRDADAVARANYRKYLNQLLSNKAGK